ncbi:MAG: hypothetical protein WA785_07180 [Candidatus Acidiferrales bacterium]
MSRIERIFSWLNDDILRAAVIAGLVLFALSYVCDAIMYYFGVAAAKTLLNDLAVAVAGAVLLVIFLSQSRKNQLVAQAKARALIVQEVSHYVRDAFTPLAQAMSSPDAAERLRILDIATDRVDYVLSEVLPTVGTAHEVRYF